MTRRTKPLRTEQESTQRAATGEPTDRGTGKKIRSAKDLQEGSRAAASKAALRELVELIAEGLAIRWLKSLDQGSPSKGRKE